MSVVYCGKKVYVGIDVHKKTFAISAICAGMIVKKATITAIPSTLKDFLSNHFPGDEIVCGYEAGFSGFHLQRSITSRGHTCLVVNPGSLEVASRDRVKTDKRDSLKIAEHFAHNRIKSVRIPTPENEEARMLSRSRSQIVKQHELQAHENSKLEEVYRSAPGIGAVTSRVLANELGDMSHFKTEDSLFSFVGLTPTEKSSGDSTRKEHISRQGNPRIRHALTEIALRAIGQDVALRAIYDRISGRAGGKRAIVAVARRIVGRIRACFAKNETWKLNFQRSI